MIRIATALTALLTLTSCMTLDTRGDPTYDGSRVYSGARVDLVQAAVSFRDFNVIGFVLFAGDLPLSFVADTLLLPVTIGEESRRRERITEEQRVDVERPSVLGADASGTPLELAERLFAACLEKLERNDPGVADCYGLRSEVRFAGGEPAKIIGGAYKIRVRAVVADAQRRGDLFAWRDPVYREDGEGVRIDAVLWSALDGELGPVSLHVGPDADGQWRILNVKEERMR